MNAARHRRICTVIFLSYGVLELVKLIKVIEIRTLVAFEEALPEKAGEIFTGAVVTCM